MAGPSRVESMAGSCTTSIPAEFIRPEEERITLEDALDAAKYSDQGPQIPIIDLSGFLSGDEVKRVYCLEAVKEAAKTWGVMHIINHGIPLELIRKMQATGEKFFNLPVEEKELYANDQSSGNIQGYGSKLANNASGRLEWQDYFFHLIFPEEKADYSIWPKKPADYV